MRYIWREREIPFNVVHEAAKKHLIGASRGAFLKWGEGAEL